MKLRGILAIVFSLSLALFAGNALAGGKSDKSDKSVKSEKSLKSEKSGKRGNGYGHCKSDKSGKGHSKKRGKGHNRDCDDGGDPPPVVERNCAVDLPTIAEITYEFDEPSYAGYAGNGCDADPAAYDSYRDDGVIVVADVNGNYLCAYDPSSSEVGAEVLNTVTLEFYYPIDIRYTCALEE